MLSLYHVYPCIVYIRHDPTYVSYKLILQFECKPMRTSSQISFPMSSVSLLLCMITAGGRCSKGGQTARIAAASLRGAIP